MTTIDTTDAKPLEKSSSTQKLQAPESLLAADSKPLIIGGREFSSRLMVGTGKYKDFSETSAAVAASGAQMITVALRRTNIGQDAQAPNILDILAPSEYTILPNTAGCFNVEDAYRTCQMSRELLDGAHLVKLEVLGDTKTLFPHIMGTIEAARRLVDDGFDVMVYTSDDPIVAQELESMGCVAVMPLAAPIGSGLGIQDPYKLLEIIENAQVPIIVDAGVGTASDASIAMELGCDGVLMNTAIAAAQQPVRMALAMKLAVEAGRQAFLSGRMEKKRYASASSPLSGTFF